MKDISYTISALALATRDQPFKVFLRQNSSDNHKLPSPKQLRKSYILILLALPTIRLARDKQPQ